jgi:hypothetical protein
VPSADYLGKTDAPMWYDPPASFWRGATLAETGKIRPSIYKNRAWQARQDKRFPSLKIESTNYRSLMQFFLLKMNRLRQFGLDDNVH